MGKLLTIQEADDRRLMMLKSSLLVPSKVEVLRRALDLLEETLERQRRVERWKKAARLVSGQGGHESMKVNREFPPMVVQMITVGEASGTLDHMLAEIADHYDELVHHGVKRVTSLVEPLFLIVMGGMVAFIMASVLLPLFRMVKVIHH